MSHRALAPSSLKTRLRAHLGLKFALALGLNLFALVPYFWLQRQVFFPVTVMTPNALDIWLGFHPQAVWLYLSLFLLMPIGPMQFHSIQQIRRYALGVVAISLMANLIFWFWPTAVERPTEAAANALYRWLTTWDLSHNAFPSLHAAMAVYSACCCEQILSHVRRRAFSRSVVWTWALVIIAAMLCTKQHVALDALAGAVLGFVSYRWAFRISPLGEKQKHFQTEMIKREGWTT